MANTPNLDLVKPAGTDHALVSVINSNSDKIDAGVGTLSEQIGTLRTCENLGTISSQSDLETALNTVVSGMAVNSNKAIQINCTSSFSAFSGSTVYNAMVSKGGQSNNYATVLFQSINGTGNAIIKATKNQSWRFEQLALESEITPDLSGEVTWNTGNVTGDPIRDRYQKMGKLVVITIEFTPISGKIANGNVICSGLPIPANHNLAIGMVANNSVRVTNAGDIIWYYPQNTSNLQRVDLNMSYFSYT